MPHSQHQMSVSAPGSCRKTTRMFYPALAHRMRFYDWNTKYDWWIRRRMEATQLSYVVEAINYEKTL